MEVTAKKNPIIRKRGVCDPHVHIFRDRAYLYASHDCDDGTQSGDFDHMNDWEIWSSADLVTWRRESVVSPADTPIGDCHYCWAVDAAEKDGRYFLYVSRHVWETYVLASDDPGKGFVPARQDPVLPRGLTKTRSYDPAVFTDGSNSYIVFGTPVWAGGDSYYIARLNEDMCTLAETPKKIIVNDLADDKPFLHKHDGVYYLTWASFYATADNVYGPYTLRGNIGLTHDHGSFFEWNGQQFMAFTVNESLNQPTIPQSATTLQSTTAKTARSFPIPSFGSTASASTAPTGTRSTLPGICGANRWKSRRTPSAGSTQSCATAAGLSSRTSAAWKRMPTSRSTARACRIPKSRSMPTASVSARAVCGTRRKTLALLPAIGSRPCLCRCRQATIRCALP